MANSCLGKSVKAETGTQPSGLRQESYGRYRSDRSERSRLVCCGKIPNQAAPRCSAAQEFLQENCLIAALTAEIKLAGSTPASVSLHHFSSEEMRGQILG